MADDVVIPADKSAEQSVGVNRQVDFDVDLQNYSSVVDTTFAQRTVDNVFGTPAITSDARSRGPFDERRELEDLQRTRNPNGPPDADWLHRLLEVTARAEAHYRNGNERSPDATRLRTEIIESLPPSEQIPFWNQMHRAGLIDRSQYYQRLAEAYSRNLDLGNTQGNSRNLMAAHLGGVMARMSPDERHQFQEYLRDYLRTVRSRRSGA